MYLALITTKQVSQLTHDLQSFLAWLSLVFGLLMALFSILMLVISATLEQSLSGRVVLGFSNFVLPVLVMAVSIWIATITGAGIAGALSILYGLFFTAIALGLAIAFKKAIVVAICLIALSLIIATTLGGMDIYDVGHCLGHGTLC